MDKLTTIWRMLVAGFFVLRLARLLLDHKDGTNSPFILLKRPENLFGSPTLDCVCLLSVWLSAQTAIWVAGGLAGLLLNWFAITTISRILAPSSETPAQLRAEASNGDRSCIAVERTMQVNHA